MKCFCNSGLSFDSCCRPYHDSKAIADTAEQLMRSRYSAFVLLNEDYLRRTWAASQCPQELLLDEKTKWIKLDIISTSNGQKDDLNGKVEFKAGFIQNDELACVHEISDFIRQQGRWVYHSGQLFDEPVEVLTMSRSCPCGSGKKYKRCCRNK